MNTHKAKVRLNFVVSPELNQTLEELAEKTGGSKTEVFRRAIALMEVVINAKQQRYSLPIISVSAAFGLTIQLWFAFQGTPALLFFAAVTLSAWHGGLKSGLFATFLATVLLNSLPGNTFNYLTGSLPGLIQISMFAGVSVLINSLVEDRRRAEFKAHKQQEKIRLITDAVPIAICYVDAEQRYQFNNKTYQNWLGYSDNTILSGQRLENILGQALYQRIYEKIQRVLAGQKISYEANLSFPDQQSRHIQATYIPHFDEQGKVIGFFASLEDLTEQKQTQQALKQERDFISSILSTVSSLIVVLDGNGRIVRFNQACENLTGYTFSEIQGKPIWEVLIAPEEIAEVQAVFQNLVAGYFPNEYENYWLTKNKQYRLITWSNTAIVNSEGKVEYVIGTGIDITEQRQIETALATYYTELESRVQERTLELIRTNEILESQIAERQQIEIALRKSEEKFRSLSACSPVGIFTTDINGHCTYTNPRFEGICGKIDPATSGLSWTAAIHPEDRAQIMGQWQECTRRGTEYTGEFRLLTPKGTVRWALVATSPMFSDTQELIGHVGTLKDITDRVEAQQALARSEQEFKALVENTPDVIIRIDHNLRYAYVNPVVERLTGRPIAEFIGKTSQELGEPPELCQKWDEVLHRVFTTGSQQVIEYQVNRANSLFTYQSRIVPEFDPNGRVQSALVVARDITELKQAERERAQLIAEQAARAQAEAEQQRASFIAQASTVLAASLDYETTLKNVAELAVPTIADGCYIDIVEKNGEVRRLSATHTDPAKVDLFQQVEQCYPTAPNAPHGYRLVLRTGQPELIPQITDELLREGATDTTHLEMLRQLDLGSHLCVPLLARNRVLGAITFITQKTGRQYSDEDLRFLEDLASRAALAVDNARLYREAQKALAQTAESFALIDSLLEAAPLAIGFLDQDLRFVRINQVLAKLNGLSVEQHLGRTFRELLPESASRFETVIQQVLHTGQPVLNLEIEGQPPGQPGHFGYWLGNYYPVKAGDGQTVGVGLILTDITEAKKAEAALRESEVRFRSVVESNMIGIGFWESNGKITDANDALLKMLGYDRETLFSRQLTWQDITPPEEQDTAQQVFGQIQTNGICIPFEKEFLRTDGSRLPTLAGGAHFEGCQDKGTFFVLDLSDRKRAEAAEQAANRKLVSILESVTDAFFAVNRDWQFTYVNNRCEKVMGRAKEELLGLNMWEAFPEAKASAFYEQYHRAMYQQVPVHLEATVPDRTGRWFEAHAYPWSDGLAVYFQEVTKRKRLEQALRDSEAKVRQQLLELDHIYNATPVGMCFVDTNLRFVRVNEQLAAFNGRPISNHLGKTIRDVLPELADSLEPLYNHVIETQTPILNLELQAETIVQPGIPRDWLESLYPVCDDQGVLLGVSSVVQDITERKRAERALRESEAIFRRLFEANIFGVSIGDFSGLLTYANDALLKMVGYTREEMLAGALRWDSLTPPEYSALDALSRQELRTTGVATPFEKEYVRSDGSRVPLLVGSALLEEPECSADAMITFYIDLTEIKRVEAELKQNQARLQLAQQAGKIGTFEWNIQTGEVIWTPELATLYGIALSEFNGKFENWTQFLSPADQHRVTQEMQDAASSGTEFNSEFRIRRPDGQIRWLAARATVIQDESGQPLRMIGVSMDISDRKWAEEALLETNQTLEALIRACPLGITVFSAEDGTVKMWNPAAEKIFGWTEAEAKGQSMPSVPTEKQSEFLNNLKIIRDGQELTNLETRRQRKDGSTIDLSLWATPVPDAKGKVNCMSIVADITERKQVEAERAQLLVREQTARAEAEVANRMKDEFLATLSHELRTPLNAMLGWAQLLRSRKFDEATTARALETIERQARLQKQLIEDLLDVSRIIQGKLCLNVRWLNLVEVIEIAMNSVSLMAQAKSISLEVNLNAVSSLMWGDAERLQQVVWNLLSNAIKFTPNGGRVDVSLSRISEPSSRKQGPAVNYVQIQVKDTGRGISPEFLPYVFERFRQADSSLTRLYGGLGLGLAIVRHLVELHGGSVKAESLGEGKGSTFTVRLPLREMKETSAPVAGEPSSVEGSSVVPVEGLQVLIVEDETDSREFLAAMLEQYGATVIAVGSVAEAMMALENWQPDILVSDIGMPVEDGYALIHQVRALESAEGTHLPAVALTAYAREQDRSQALAAGYDDHLSKPVEPGELFATMARLVKKSPK